jgi:hypothetical protein
MTPQRFRVAAFVALAALGCAGLSGACLHAQAAPAAPTISIRMYDARSGRQLTPSNFVIRFNHQDDIRNDGLRIDDDGTGKIAVPSGSSFLAVDGTFDRSMEVYINCDTGMEKDDRRRHWYSIADILSTGVIAPNECFKGKYEHPRVALQPGEFVFYVRERNWRDPSSY